MRDIPIDEIFPNDYNPNEMTAGKFAECKKEIEHLGTLPKPIIVRPSAAGKFIIIDGEHNWRAAKDLGLPAVPCEVLEADDLESMRQTYKRNMHGTFNQAKLGAMFDRALSTAGWSQRELARQFNMSEGTVRNALLYHKADGLRNGYAFGKLSIRQIRVYLALPPIIRDKWLDAGADIKLLLTKRDLRSFQKENGRPFGDSDWDQLGTYARKKGEEKENAYINEFHKIHNAGLSDVIKGTNYAFRESFERAEDFLRWEYYRICPNEELQKQVREYTKHYIEEPDFIRDEFKEAFRLVYLDGDFRVTPDEFSKILANSKLFGCPAGQKYKYPQSKYIKQALFLLLTEKGVLKEDIDIDNLPDPREKLILRKFEKGAPDYIKQAEIPAILKVLIFDYTPNDVDLKTIEQAKKDVIAEYAALIPTRSFWHDPKPEEVKKKINQKIFNIQREQVLAGMSNSDLAEKMISFAGLDKDGTDGDRLNEVRLNLIILPRDILLKFYDFMGYIRHIKVMRELHGDRD